VTSNSLLVTEGRRKDRNITFPLTSCKPLNAMWKTTNYITEETIYRVSQEECARLREGVP
jgi:hypothetical protein